jgi:hypothetical protein
MADLKKVKDLIREIAGRPKNVTLSEIEKVAEQLKSHGFVVNTRLAGDHAKLFHIGNQVFSICTHHRGSKQLKPNYVKDFLNAMIELELYE